MRGSHGRLERNEHSIRVMYLPMQGFGRARDSRPSQNSMTPWIRFVMPIVLAASLFLPSSLRGEDRPLTRIAVLLFDNESVTDRERFEPFRRGIADALATELSREKRFILAERTRIEALLSELNLSTSGLVDTASAQRLGRMLGVQALVLGSFSTIGEMVRIDARFAEVETGRILAAEEVSGETANLFELEQALAVKIVDGVRTRFPGREERPGKEGADGALAGMAGPVGGGQPDRLAVFPLEDLDEPSGPGKWGEEIAAGLTGSLSGNRDVEIVDRKRLRMILGGLASRADGRPDEGASLKAGGIAGANILVLGSFLVFDGRIKIHVRLVKTETGEVITAVRAEGKVGERSKLTQHLGEKIFAAGLK